jgi:hypothetical protein
VHGVGVDGVGLATAEVEGVGPLVVVGIGDLTEPIGRVIAVLRGGGVVRGCAAGVLPPACIGR